MTPLRQRFIEDMLLRGLAPTTQRSYIHYVSEFAKYFNMSPEKLDLEAIRQYQLHLLHERKLSPESINTFTSAVQFFYLVTVEVPWGKQSFPRMRTGTSLPVVLSPEETETFFANVPSLKYRAALMLCYGAGLRISEAVAVKVSDIDSKRGLIRIEEGKGGKDRYVMLSRVLLEVLRSYWRAARPKDWLFPSWRKNKHLTVGAVSQACMDASKQCGLTKRIADYHPHPPAFVRHASSAGRHRHQSHTGAAGAQPHRNHGALYESRGASDRCHHQSSRQAGEQAETEAPEITPGAPRHSRSGRHFSTAWRGLPGGESPAARAALRYARH